jgi:hypothetical protein
MECWNTGFGGRRSVFLYGHKIKKQTHIRPLSPIFHYSNIPLDVSGQTPPLSGEIKVWSSGPGFFTFILILSVNVKNVKCQTIEFFK